MNQPRPPAATESWVSVRTRAVQAVHSPLGFCVLALTVVEAFLLGAGIWFDLDNQWKLTALAVGVLLFLIVFGTVIFLVVKYPQNLVFSEESHIQYAAIKMFGSETKSITGKDLEALRQESTNIVPVAHSVSADD